MKYRESALANLKHAPMYFVYRNIHKLVRNPARLLADVRNVVSVHNAPFIDIDKTDAFPAVAKFSQEAAKSVGFSEYRLSKNNLKSHLGQLSLGSKYAVTHYFGCSAGKVGCASRYWRPKNARFSYCFMGGLTEGLLADVTAPIDDDDNIFIGNRPENLSLILMDSTFENMAAEEIVATYLKGELSHNDLKLGARNIVVVDPKGGLARVLWDLNYHANLVVWLSQDSGNLSDDICNLLEVATIAVAPSGLLGSKKLGGNLVEYNEGACKASIWRRVVLSLGDKPKNMLMPAFNGGFFYPELFEKDATVEGVCVLNSSNNGQHNTFDSIVEELAGRVKGIFLREELVLKFADQIKAAEESGCPKNLLLATLKAGVRYDCETFNSTH